MTSSLLCQECGAPLTADDIGLYRKMVYRGADTFSCTVCLAKRFGVPVSKLEAKIREYKELGCLLFVQDQ